MMMLVSASVMCADLLHLERDLLALKEANVEYYHVDIMDGNFVNNITLGIDCCRKMTGYGIPRDIHLLVANPEKLVDRFALEPDEILQAHYESNINIQNFLDSVHKLGAKAGIVLNPESEIELLAPYLDSIEYITLMMIQPGFSGLPMEDGMLEKIRYTRDYLDQHGYRDIIIQVDGHVDFELTPLMWKNGAEMFVAGTSSVFKKEITIQEGVARLRACINA